MAQTVKCLPTMRETQVRSLDREDPLEKEMETHSSTLAWKISWTEEPGRLQSMGLQRVRHDWATSLHFISRSAMMRNFESKANFSSTPLSFFRLSVKQLCPIELVNFSEQLPAVGLGDQEGCCWCLFFLWQPVAKEKGPVVVSALDSKLLERTKCLSGLKILSKIA